MNTSSLASLGICILCAYIFMRGLLGVLYEVTDAVVKILNSWA